MGDSEGWGNLVCYSGWGLKELDTTEWLNNNQWKIPGKIFLNYLSRPSIHYKCPYTRQTKKTHIKRGGRSKVITEAETGVMPPQTQECRSWESQGTEYLPEPLWGEQHCQFTEKLKQWLWQFWYCQSGFFPRMPSIGIWLMCFSLLKWGYAFLGGKPQRESTQCIKCTYYQYDFHCWYWPWSSGSGSISPLLSYSFFPSFA